MRTAISCCAIITLFCVFINTSSTSAQFFQLRDGEKKILEEKTLSSDLGSKAEAATKQQTKRSSGVVAAAMVLPSECDLFAVRPLQHVVSSLLEKVNVTSNSLGGGQSISVALEAQLSQDDLKVLEDFLKDPATALEALDHVKMILTTFLHRSDPSDLGALFWSFGHRLAYALGVIFSLRAVIYVLVCFVFSVLTLLLMWRMVASREMSAIVKNGLLLLLVIGLAWEFYAMVEKARARNAARLAQLPEMPKECNYDQLSPWETTVYHLRQILGVEDPCVEYFTLNAIDPVLEISPASAMIKACGKWAAQFSSAFTGLVPFWFRPILALTVALVMPFLFFLGVFNYKLRTPLISVEPAAPSTAAPITDLLVGQNGLLSSLTSSNTEPVRDGEATLGTEQELQGAIEDQCVLVARQLSEPDSGEVSEISSSETEPEEDVREGHLDEVYEVNHADEL